MESRQAPAIDETVAGLTAEEASRMAKETSIDQFQEANMIHINRLMEGIRIKAQDGEKEFKLYRVGDRGTIHWVFDKKQCVNSENDNMGLDEYLQTYGYQTERYMDKALGKECYAIKWEVNKKIKYLIAVENECQSCISKKSCPLTETYAKCLKKTAKFIENNFGDQFLTTMACRSFAMDAAGNDT